ncbi:DNA primase [Martelella endophytica]|uniref:DNA primase n=1 Tax=Martelella endophytica TaxID=1486262 RepID=A0A0D5LP75_MAREN|nr:DNA primase [Martelella endophytica]AJY46029.1 DNA primase [Martelella endophytica]
MRFPPSFLDEIRDRVPISNVIAQRVTWDRKKTNVGRGDFWACCPFHGEKTPSFHCEDRKGRYHCFGCGVTGDHFRFLTDLEGMSFPEAVERIADMAGVPMPARDPEAERREEKRRTLTDVMELAAAFFQDQLQTSAGAKARAYLRERGLSARTIDTFRLGFAPDSRNALKEYLAGKGVDKQEMEACGLLVHGPDIPVSYDRFRDRIMFPILSSRDAVIAFGGRAMRPDAMAKYLNSNETELFHKSNVLFNFTRARRSLSGAGGASTVIAVEGYMDVIALHQAGVENAVAPLGTALTENQLQLLWRMVDEPVLCFDGDGAGQRAAARAAGVAMPLLKPGKSLKFAYMPDGKDPDDLVREGGRQAFDEVLRQARPLADTVFEREMGDGDNATPEHRAAIEARVNALVQTIADESVRRHYQQEFRNRLFQRFRGGGRPRGERGNFSGRQGRGGGFQPAQPVFTASERLSRALSGTVAGAGGRPSFRECLIAVCLISQPALVREDFDSIAALAFGNVELRAFWPSFLALASQPGIDREKMRHRLAEAGFGDLVARLHAQVNRNLGWIAGPDAALEDVREVYGQALSLHNRVRSLEQQRVELEREIAEATEAGNLEAYEELMAAMVSVQNEISRIANQEAEIDGFGLMSGRGGRAGMG